MVHQNHLVWFWKFLWAMCSVGLWSNINKLTLNNNTKSHFHLDLLAIERDITELWEIWSRRQILILDYKIVNLITWENKAIKDRLFTKNFWTGLIINALNVLCNKLYHNGLLLIAKLAMITHIGFTDSVFQFCLLDFIQLKLQWTYYKPILTCLEITILMETAKSTWKLNLQKQIRQNL